MKRRYSIITLLLTLSMVFSTSAFAVFADTATEQKDQLDKSAPATEEVVNETPEEPAATPEQPADVQAQGTEAVEPAGELTPAEEPSVKSYDDYLAFGPTTESDAGDGWIYDKESNTLTLNNYNSACGILFNNINLNVVLKGNNTVKKGIHEEGSVDYSLEISGNGSLTIEEGTFGGGLVANTVAIKDGVINIKDVSDGIYACNTLITGGTVNIDAGDAIRGMDSSEGMPKISVKGGTLNANGSWFGIYVDIIDFSGGNVRVTGVVALFGRKIAFSGDVHADIETIKPEDGDYYPDYPAVYTWDKDGITLSDDLQIVLPENGKIAKYDQRIHMASLIEDGTMIADASGNPAKHVIIDRVKNPSGLLLAKAVAKGKTNMAISWTAMNDVDGYDVFFARCNTKSKKYAPELVASVDKGTTSYTVSGLKKGTAYKAYVQAYIMKSGAKQYVGKSLSTHAYAGGSSKKFTNPKSVKVKKAKVSIKKGKTYKINASVRKLRKSKKLISAEHAKKLRYLSSNTSIATVSKKGKIKAVTPGTCTVYAIAANGVYKTVNVTVK